MNDQNDQNGGNPLDQDAPIEATDTRAASVSLRTPGEYESDAALMDPANRSLAEALRITYRLLQFAMVVLALLFVFSGFQSVREVERGISVLFGKVQSAGLEPGFHFAAPAPFGELVKVDIGARSPELTGAFWPPVRQGQSPDNVAALPQDRKLNPEQTGSNITADLNLAHTLWRATYRRADVVPFVTNIDPDFEDELVTAALSRAILQVAGTTSIDDLLKGDTQGIAEQVRARAQRLLDEIAGPGRSSGIELDLVDLQQKIPPTRLLDRFQAVNNARSQGQTLLEQAASARETTLNGVAGPAARAVSSLIDRYELAVETGESEEAEAILAEIDAVFAGEPVTIDGTERPDAISGEVAQILAAARNERYATVARAESDLRLFNAKLAQFQANPSLTIERDHAEALSAFLTQEFVETMLLPEDINAYIVVNPDPAIAREMERARNRLENERAQEQRMRDLRERQFETRQGIQREEQ